MANFSEDWELEFRLSGGTEGAEVTSCGNEDCKFGVYSRKKDLAESTAPGCATCGVIGVSLACVFDEEAPRYHGPVPECFEVATAVELVRISNSDLANGQLAGKDYIHRITRRKSIHETVVRLASGAGFEYVGDHDLDLENTTSS